MGVGVDALRRVGNAHAVQQRNGLLARDCGVHAAVQAQRLGHLAADGVYGVERGHGLLEHHADAVAAQLAHLRIGAAHQFLPVKADAAGDLRAFGQQAHE